VRREEGWLLIEISKAPEIYPRSVVQSSDTRFFLARGEDKVLGVRGDTTGFEGAHNAEGKLLRDSHGHWVIQHDLFNHDGLTADGIAEAFTEFAAKEKLGFF
jgi:hypothetical protein